MLPIAAGVNRDTPLVAIDHDFAVVQTLAGQGGEAHEGGNAQG